MLLGGIRSTCSCSTFPSPTPRGCWIGRVGDLEHVPENRVELVAHRSLRRDVVAALRAAHPYEEVAFLVIEMADPDA